MQENYCFFYLHQKFEIDAKENETSTKPASFCVKNMYFQSAFFCPKPTSTRHGCFGNLKLQKGTKATMVVGSTPWSTRPKKK